MDKGSEKAKIENEEEQEWENISILNSACGLYLEKPAE